MGLEPGGKQGCFSDPSLDGAVACKQIALWALVTLEALAACMAKAGLFGSVLGALSTAFLFWCDARNLVADKPCRCCSCSQCVAQQHRSHEAAGQGHRLSKPQKQTKTDETKQKQQNVEGRREEEKRREVNALVRFTWAVWLVCVPDV